MWIKEEPTDINEIKQIVEWMHEELKRVAPDDVDIDEIVQNCLSHANHQQMRNPVLNYTYYLIFESLVLKQYFDYDWKFGGHRLPLWIYHNGVVGSRLFSIEFISREYYESYKQDSPVLDVQGEFGEFVQFLHDLRSDDLFDLGGAELDWFFDGIVNPSWREVLQELSVEEQQKWNPMYDLEDWIYHGVF